MVGTFTFVTVPFALKDFQVSSQRARPISLEISSFAGISADIRVPVAL